MPLPFVVSGALLTGAASGIWSYNRENYMWDWQNRQARDFQIQNMIVSRYGLFREDIRDLAGLTTTKMDSYLVVNTLKLGFIVSVFFNYDRTDAPMQEGSPVERQFVLMFSVCFLTAFQLLLTSVWFSMHASVVAQSFMTKMLLQTVRIPFPSDKDISATAPEAGDYERDLATAFRIPLMQSRGAPPPVSSTGGGVSSGGSSAASTAGSVSQASSVRFAGPSSGLLSVPLFNSDGTRRPDVDRRQSAPNLVTRTASARSPRALQQPSVPEETTSAWSEDDNASPTDCTAPSEFSGRSNQSQAPNVAPHLKFYGLVMANWQPFDLYSKICMSIGTSAMLSGLAYYAIFYTRPPPTERSTINAQTEGWYTFLFMSVLAWWSVTLDLILSAWEHVLAGLVALGAPFCVVLISLCDDRSLFLMPIAVLLQGSWVWFLCGTAVAQQDGWPRRWRASLFLDVLGMHGVGAAGASGRRTSSTPCRSSVVEILQCLRVAVALPMPEQLAEEVRRTVSRLEEALAVSGTPPPAVAAGGSGLARQMSAGAGFSRQASSTGAGFARQTSSTGAGFARQTSSEGNGFWLVVPAQDSTAGPCTHWIPSASGTAHGASGQGAGAAQAATLEELLGAAHSLLAAMFVEEASPAWTAEDAEQLAQYGGMGSTVEGFECQFRSKGLGAKSNMGKAAHRFFRISVFFVCTSWATAVFWCLFIHFKHHHRRRPQSPLPGQAVLLGLGDYVSHALSPWLVLEPPVPTLLRILSHEPLRLPRPWYSPSMLACSPDGRRIALADGVRAFARAVNGSWLGPFAACGGADVAAIAFAPSSEDASDLGEDELELVAATAGGATPLPLGPDDLERCEASAWATAARTPSLSSSSSSSSSSPSTRPSALALDGAALGDGAGGLRGLVVRGGQLLALEPTPLGAWEVAGALPSPPRGAGKWVAVALRDGIAFALDHRGSVFGFDAMSGRWTGSTWGLEEQDGLTWRGLCAVSGGSHGPHWIALAERTEVLEGTGAGSSKRSSWELWRVGSPRSGSEAE